MKKIYKLMTLVVLTSQMAIPLAEVSGFSGKIVANAEEVADTTNLSNIISVTNNTPSIKADGSKLAVTANISTAETDSIKSGTSIVISGLPSSVFNYSNISTSGSESYGTYSYDESSGNVTFTFSKDISGKASLSMNWFIATKTNKTTDYQGTVSAKAITTNQTYDLTIDVPGYSITKFTSGSEDDQEYRVQQYMPGYYGYNTNGLSVPNNYEYTSGGVAYFKANQKYLPVTDVLDLGGHTTNEKNRKITYTLTGTGGSIDETKIKIADGTKANPFYDISDPSFNGVYTVSKISDTSFTLSIADDVNITRLLVFIPVGASSVKEKYALQSTYTSDEESSLLLNKSTTINLSYVATAGGFVPKITSSNKSVNTNTQISNTTEWLLNGVTATDEEDGDLSSSVTVQNDGGFAAAWAAKTPGDYTVTYSVTDKDGNNTTATSTVTITTATNTDVTVTFEAEKGGTLSGTTSVTVPAGTKVSELPGTVADSSDTEDIFFLDWYQDGKVVNPKDVTINSDTTFTAKFGAAVYRLYNKNNGDHLLTKNKNEKNDIAAKGWTVETTNSDYGRAAFYVPVKADSADKQKVYRIYNPNSGEHFYTTLKGEADAAVKAGWQHETDEDYTWVSDGNVEMYREFNPDVHTAGSHNYTTNLGEHNWVVSQGWKDEAKDTSLWKALKAGF